MSRRVVGRTVQDAAKRANELIPLPRHPYRDSAVFYAILAGCLVGVTYATGGGVVRSVAVAAAFFVIATAFSWWRFRAKLEGRAREADRR